MLPPQSARGRWRLPLPKREAGVVARAAASIDLGPGAQTAAPRPRARSSGRACNFRVLRDLAYGGAHAAETIPMSQATSEFITTEAELDALYGPSPEAAIIKELDYISDHYRSFIEASPFLILATSGPEG